MKDRQYKRYKIKPIKRIEITFFLGKEKHTKHILAGPGKCFTEPGIDNVLDAVATDLEKNEEYEFRLVELGKGRFNFIGTLKPSVLKTISDHEVGSEGQILLVKTSFSWYGLVVEPKEGYQFFKKEDAHYFFCKKS